MGKLLIWWLQSNRKYTINFSFKDLIQYFKNYKRKQMKKYFAKYLPVEGEIKEDDYYFIENSTLLIKKDKELEEKYPIPADNYSKIKVKLFLCSKDIQEGDALYYPDSKGPEIADSTEKHQAWIKQYGLFKRIGEISPEAVWVKEGDEFDEEDIRVLGENMWGERHPICLYKPKDNPQIYCEIKGPCKHFH